MSKEYHALTFAKSSVISFNLRELKSMVPDITIIGSHKYFLQLTFLLQFSSFSSFYGKHSQPRQIIENLVDTNKLGGS
jgi:hypothetical protein